MKILSEQPEELSRDAHYEDEWKKNNGTMNSPGPSKEDLDNLFLGSKVTTFLQQFRTEQECTWKKIRQMLVWDNRTKVLIHRKHEKFSMPPDRLVTQVPSDTLKRMYVTRGLGKKYGPTPGCPGCATIGSHHQASHSDTCRDRMRAELEKSEEGREYLAREQARVDARKQEQPSSSSHKRAVSEEWDGPPEKFWGLGEEDATMKQDITATSGASSSSAEDQPWTFKVDRPGNELPVFKQKI